MPNYKFDAVRWLRSNAKLAVRYENNTMAVNLTMCAEEVERLRAELAALKEAARPIAEWWRGGGVEGVIKGVGKPIDTGQLDALAALVGEG